MVNIVRALIIQWFIRFQYKCVCERARVRASGNEHILASHGIMDEFVFCFTNRSMILL